MRRVVPPGGDENRCTARCWHLGGSKQLIDSSHRRREYPRKALHCDAFGFRIDCGSRSKEISPEKRSFGHCEIKLCEKSPRCKIPQNNATIHCMYRSINRKVNNG